MRAIGHSVVALVTAGAAGFSAGTAIAGHATWQVLPGSGVTFAPDVAFYFFACPPGGLAGPVACAPDAFTLEGERWWTCGAFLSSPLGPCGSATSVEDAVVRLAGEGAHNIVIRLAALAYDDYDCCISPGGPYASISLTTPSALFLLTVSLTGKPPGTPVTVFYHWGWDAAARPEGPLSGTGGGNLAASAGSMTANGIPLVGGQFDIWDTNSGASGTGTGSFTTTTGSVIPIDLSAYVDAWCLPPPGTGPGGHWQGPEHDTASARVDVVLRLAVAPDDGGGGGGPPEACCFEDGSCADLAPEVCTLLEGVPQGPGTTCATVVCPPPPPLDQACCFPDTGTCADLPPEACTDLGGIPAGPGTECASTVCTIACCYPGGTCADTGAATCASTGGTPMGPGTTCATIPCPGGLPQACCLPLGGCVIVPPGVCTVVYGGTPQGPGTTCLTFCPPPSPPEACCYADGACVDLSPPACTGSGGTPMGPGTICPLTVCPILPEACCYPGGGCAELDPGGCALSGGTPQGPGTSCATATCPVPPPPREACCLPDGECIMAPPGPGGCELVGGTPQGAGTTCATTLCGPPCAPPVIVSAVSRHTHGSAGTFDLDILAPAAVEPRMCKPLQIVITFDQPVAPCDGELAAGDEVSTNLGTITGLALAGNVLTIDLVPDPSCLKIHVEGLCCIPGGGSMVPADFKLIILGGDVDASKAVNIVDLNEVKTALFKPVNATRYRRDVNCDGVLNIEDLNKTKQGLFKTSICP